MTACWLELALVTGGAKLSVLPDLQLDKITLMWFPACFQLSGILL